MADTSCAFYDIGCQWTWIVDEIKAFFVWVSEQVLNGILAVVQAIPMPSWTHNAGSLSLPSSILWVANAFELHYGVMVVASAYGVRFLIRRLPIVG